MPKTFGFRIPKSPRDRAAKSTDAPPTDHPATEPALSMRGIRKTYPGVIANDNVDLDVYPGEIHGLLGENGAGKTTLMKILYGLAEPDAGSIRIKGRPIELRSPKDAVDAGIGMVHQHFMLVPDMTVAENVALGYRTERFPLTDLAGVSADVTELSRIHGLEVDPEAVIEDLSVGARRRVEILKLLHRSAEILILDEPTSVLRPQEWKDLALVLRSLVAEGRAAVFITHKLDEVMAVADRCTVLRDGAVVGTVDVKDTDKASLARMMVGRPVVFRAARVEIEPGEAVLEVENLSLTDSSGKAVLDGMTFEVRSGEVLGVAGVDGNGQTELVDVLTGMIRPTTGRILIGGKEVDRLTPAGFRRRSGGVITEDRHKTGLALDLSLRDNLIMRDYRDRPLSSRGLLELASIRKHCVNLIRCFDVRTPSQTIRMRQLSGGNQQKSILARELYAAPNLLVASQPTRGLDVGAMEFVYSTLLERKRAGSALLLISTELDEILSLSDRIAVIASGRLLRILAAEEADAETLGLLMGGEG